MGIDVFDQTWPKTVVLNDAHEKRVVTAVDKNPSRSSIDGVVVHNVFRRTKTGDPDRDGNPLIYAMKGLNSYTITPFWRRQILNRAVQIIDKMTADLAGFQYVLPIPSSNVFCADFAALVVQAIGALYLPPTFIRKRTADEVVAGFSAIPADLRRQDRQAFGRQLKIWRGLPVGSSVEMKLVAPAVRPYVGAFTTTGLVPDLQGTQILIADDLHSTGASIASVAKILKNQGATVSAICFLSSLSS